MGKRETSIPVSLAIMAVALALIPVRGLCLAVMWGWFIVPLGVVAIGKAHAIGLGCLIALLWQKAKNKGEETDTPGALLAQAIAELTVAMGAAWVCHHFMVAP